MENTTPLNGHEPSVMATHTAAETAAETSAPAVTVPTVKAPAHDQTTEPTVSDAPIATKAAEKTTPARSEETGHAINVRNLGRIIMAILGYASGYITNNPLYLEAHLQTVLAACNSALERVGAALVGYRYGVSRQTLAFKDLKPLCTKAMNYFESCGAPAEVVAIARTYNYLIQGTRVKKLDRNALDDKHISASRQSYAQLEDNFYKLIEVFAGEVLYGTGHGDISLTALRGKLSEMRDSTKDVSGLIVGLQNARIERDVLLYKPETGLVDLSYGVKKVVCSLYGSRSPQYKQISGLAFRRIANYKYL